MEYAKSQNRMKLLHKKQIPLDRKYNRHNKGRQLHNNKNNLLSKLLNNNVFIKQYFNYLH
jgi:hypothetical protein